MMFVLILDNEMTFMLSRMMQVMVAVKLLSVYAFKKRFGDD